MTHKKNEQLARHTRLRTEHLRWPTVKVVYCLLKRWFIMSFVWAHNAKKVSILRRVVMSLHAVTYLLSKTYSLQLLVHSSILRTTKLWFPSWRKRWSRWLWIEGNICLNLHTSILNFVYLWALCCSDWKLDAFLSMEFITLHYSLRPA